MRASLYSRTSGLFHLAVVLILSVFATTTFACTTSGWAAGAVGSVNANDPTNGVSRVKGFCGLALTGTGHVMDGSPSNDPNFIGHFYFLPEFTVGPGTMKLFVAYSDEGGNAEVFSVKYDGANVIFDATAVGGTSVSVPADSDHWNLVEFAWHSDAMGSLWVNTDATIDPPDMTFTSGSGVVESVKLGAPEGLDGFVGKVTFDEYESRRENQVGALLIGDTNNDGEVNLFDISATLLEIDFFNPAIQEGTADCNKDGQVNLFDISATLLAIDFFNPIPCGSN